MGGSFASHQEESLRANTLHEGRLFTSDFARVNLTSTLLRGAGGHAAGDGLSHGENGRSAWRHELIKASCCKSAHGILLVRCIEMDRVASSGHSVGRSGRRHALLAPVRSRGHVHTADNAWLQRCCLLASVSWKICSLWRGTQQDFGLRRKACAWRVRVCGAGAAARSVT